jgi:4-amino-4-deoxy-L-arabinose transferase-like glycosyltransferase
LSQQIPPLRLRKSFLVIGIVLLIVGFSFFYWASQVSSDYVTTYKNDVNLNSPEGHGALFDAELDEYYYYLTISTTTEVHHYERPQWVYFGIGVVLSSLALVPIFKLRKKPSHVAQKAQSS